MRGGSRITDWLIGLGLPALVFAGAVAGWFDAGEAAARDLVADFTVQPVRSDRVVVVELGAADADADLDADSDQESWDHARLAELHARMATGQPRVIGYAVPLEQAENARASALLERLLERDGEVLDAAGRTLFRRALDQLGSDRRLAATFADGPPVVLAARFERSAGADVPPANRPGLAALTVAAPADGPVPPPILWPGAVPRAGAVRPPLPRFADAADAVALAGTGVDIGVDIGVDTGANIEAGDGGSVGTGRWLDGSRDRRVALARQQGEAWLPTLPLALLQQELGGGDTPIGLQPGRGLVVGDRELRTGPHPLLQLPAAAGDDAFRVIPADALLAGEVSPEVLRERVVLVGTRAPQALARANEGMPFAGIPAVDAVAWQTAALIDEHGLALPAWAIWSRIAALVAIAVYLAFVLPGLGWVAGLAVSGLLAVILINGQVLAMAVQAAWLPLLVPLAALVGGHAVHAVRRRSAEVIAGFQAELTADRVRLGAALRREGRLDEALGCLRRCQPRDEAAEGMYGLGLDCERRRRFGEAAEAFGWVARHRPDYRDAVRRAQDNRQRQEQAALGLAGNRSNTQTLLLADGEVQKPMLGRYEVEREIGKGAMGVVYLGRDPRIGRTVAIKTLALEGTLEGQSLEEIKARFLREAETAGRLKHGNIVIVHDVGEEDDVAWIAMDYLEGTPMSVHVQPDNLLPPTEVFTIMAQVADALDHAHGQGVVHRDVKPENILYDRKRGVATVTDFGVASVSDHHKTRTGTILGTPSYMSPEQVAGERVDARSDIFSAGVTLYQLLTGELPFDGDSLSNLMYRIANERHREVRRIRRELPTCATTITNRALAKQPDRRYTTAAQLARALRRCGEKTAGD